MFVDIAKRWLPPSVIDLLRPVWRIARRLLTGASLKIEYWRLMRALRATPPRERRPAGLRRDVHISLTSHPPRYRYLPLCLASLLNQSVRPASLTLWLEPAEIALLPRSVLRLTRFGLRIASCEDGLRSYKKIIPQLEETPSDYIVTADDDCIYATDWLEALISAVHEQITETLCHRAHKIIETADGMPAKYRDWEWQTTDRSTSQLIVPTGVGGVLYPPDVFDARVVDRRLFQTLAPTGDDLWLYWCGRTQGTPCRVADCSRQMFKPLPSANVDALYIENVRAYDGQIAALTTYFRE